MAVREPRPARDAERAAALEALTREHRKAVLALCLAHVRDIHEAEDRVQDVFLRACDKLHTLRDASKARAWLLQIARRLCIDHARRERPPEPLGEDHAPVVQMAENDRTEHLLSAVAKLPEDFRETIVLYYMDGRSSAGVAASLGISPAAVRQRLVRARLRLHELLTEDQT
jgi:RNA polymerase sigma-70 factor (ECF subfamily)